MRSPSALSLALVVLAAACGGGDDDGAPAQDSGAARAGAGEAAACPAGSDTTLRLPAGFCATVFTDTVGGPRHIAVAANGDVFAQMITRERSTEAGSGAGGIIALRDTNGDGRADTSAFFGRVGGTGIGLFDGYLYADETTRIVRYRLAAGSLRPEGEAEVIVQNIPRGGHDARNFVIADDGMLYLNIGSQTNSCQRKDRGNESPGIDPCTELQTRAGIWRFDARKTGQRPTVENRFATGNRNAMGLDIAPDGRLWATQHGRDQLLQNWPKLFDARYSAENPAEELQQVNQGDDFGWPYCYYSLDERKRVTAPEYGGDGKQTTRCEGKKAPAAVFPGHWAPMALLFYGGSQFPARYRNGAFITFHGSWNRAPEPQAGYRVVFQPMSGDAAQGDAETFADGFAGSNVQPNSARYRPMGLAEAPDGSLYIGDDQGGRIWKITYRGAR